MLKILIAYDGSDCSDKALLDLRRAGLPKKADVIVLTVAEMWRGASNILTDPGLVSQYSFMLENEFRLMESSLEEAKITAERAAEELRNYFPGWKIQAEAVLETPAVGVIAKAESWKPDLVILGSHGRSAAGRLVFGSVSQKVLSHLHGNLRIARGRQEESVSPPRIVVAFDGSQESEDAFQAALNRHWPKGTAIRIITAIDTRLSIAIVFPTPPIRYWMRGDDKDSVAWVHRMVDDQKRRIEEKGLIAFSDVIRGDAKDVILEKAEQWGADCIFVGPRGLGSNEKRFLGNVSTALAMRAHCSVEIVHRLWTEKNYQGHPHEEHRDCMTKEQEWCY